MRPQHNPLRSVAAVVTLTVTAACAEIPVAPTKGSDGRARFDIAEVADAQLLVCPTSDAASSRGVVGPEGGSIGARGSSITIPAGAVAEPTLFEIVVPVSHYMKVEISAVGQSYYEFLAPVAISINYARCPGINSSAESTFEGAYIASDTDQVLELMGGTLDKSGHKLTFSTTHLSGYAVAF